ncbi:MAG: chromosomal replication initiator protein DnaA [Patescibacteria group bacterium]
MDRQKLWSAVLENFKLSVSEGNFNTYFKSTQLLNTSGAGGRLVCEVGINNALIKDILDRRYYGQIIAELERLTGNKCELSFVIRSQELGASNKTVKALPLFEEKNNINSDVYKKTGLRPDFTFDNYAVSGSNQMAFAAATAVAKNPGTSYNPLFIYGGVGVGKTHLMQGIGNVLLGRGENAQLFCASEEFTNELVEAIRTKSTNNVRAKYRRVKLLMIDDVQFIAGKPTVQEEFFHTFNAIQKAGGQIVMTSDKPPQEILKLEDRLKSRFGAGMIVDVGAPDFELRSAILLIKAKNRGMELDPEISQLAAEHIEGIRELEGFLMQLKSKTEVSGLLKPNLEIASEILKLHHAKVRNNHVITPHEIINTVGEFFNVGVQQIKGDRRSAHIVRPRQILMYLLRFDAKLPTEEIGRLLGGRDHTTVMHGSEKMQLLLDTDTKLQSDIHTLKIRLGIGGA